MPGFFFVVAYKPNKDPNKREFSGTAVYKGEALGGFLEDPGIEFSYKHGRWSMTNLQLRRDATWDAKNPTGGLPFDLDKALQMGSHGGDCKDLADFVVGELLQMKFTFTLCLPNMKQSDMKAVTSSEATPEANEQANKNPNVERNENKEGFAFVVTWWIDVTIAGYNAGKVKLDDFNFTVSFKGFRATFEGLLTFLWEQVLSDKNMAEVGRKILTNPEVLGKLLTKVALEKLTDEIVERLLCRKPEQPKDKENLKERTKKIQDNARKNMDDKVDDAKKDLDKVKDGSKPSSGGGGSGGGGGGLPIPPIIPIPPIPPIIPIPLPIPMPLPIPALPSIPPSDEKPIPDRNFSLIDLIRLYLVGNGKLDSITPEQLLEGLGKKMLNHPDKDYGDYAKALHEQVQKSLAEARTNRDEAKAGIELRMALAAERLVPGYYADQAESTIGVQLIAALPSTLAVFEDDYHYVRWQIFATNEDKEPTEADKGRILTFNGTERIIVVQDDEFRYLKTVYLFVRMWVSMGNVEFSSPQWYRIALVHNKPWLRPARGLQLGYEDAADSIKVTLPPSDALPGDWSVDLVDEAATVDLSVSAPAPGSALFSSCFAAPDCRPSEFVVPVSRLGYNLRPSYKTIRALVTQKATDTNQYHESLPSRSFQSLSLTPAPSGLDACFIKQGEVEVRWLRDEKLAASAYVVTLVRNDTQTIIKAEQSPPEMTDSGFVLVSLTLPTVTATAAGELLSVRVAAKVPGCVNMISERLLEVTVPTLMTIEPESNLHVESGVLTLVVSSNTPFPQDAVFNVHCAESGAGTGRQEQEVLSQCLYDRRIVLRLRPSAPNGDFVVTAGKHATSAWTLRPWTVSDYPKLPELEAHTAGKRVLITWKDGQLGLDIDVSVYSETLLPTDQGASASGLLAFGTAAAEDNCVELGKDSEFAHIINGAAIVHVLVRAQDRKLIVSTCKLGIEF